MAKRRFVTADILKEYFTYDPEGFLIWKKCKAAWIEPGRKAGSDKGNGYREVGFLGKRYLEHRLIFLYHHGYLPDLVDHMDRNSKNNKIENLRKSNKSQNSHNSGLSVRNKSGYKGVSWDKQKNKWLVRGKVDGFYKFLGYFDSPEKASKVYIEKVINHA